MKPAAQLHTGRREVDAPAMDMHARRRTARLATALMVTSLSFGVLPAGTAAPRAAAAPASAPAAVTTRTVTGSAAKDRFEAEVLRLTNKARSHSRRCGAKRTKAVKPVRWSATLARSAHSHSVDMATRNYFSHYDKSGRSPFQRMHAAGYDYRAAGENIAGGRSLSSPKAVVRAWLKSPGHCAIIMNGLYRELGIGRVEGPGQWGVYWTQNFGRAR
ncbi:MAG: CAP domain-containing protein [Candidatus Nanopelagicales bacterium]